MAQTPTDFTFIAYGDSRGSEGSAVSAMHTEIVTAYMKHNPDFVIHTGDMVNQGGIWNQWLSFNATIQPILDAGIPLYGVVGNHEKYTDVWDVYDENFTQYQQFFDFSAVIETSEETELHYSFDYGGVHFIILNTEDYFDDSSEVFNCSQSQMDWLLSDLATTQPTDFIVAAYHRPSWSVRQFREDCWEQAETVRREFHQLFVEYDVDIVFCGHDHFYYRGVRDGIYYVVTGGGGAPLYTPDPSAPHWQAGDVANRTHHYCKIDVTPDLICVTVLHPENSTVDFFTLEPVPQPYLIPLEFQLLIVVSICGIIIYVAVVFYLKRQHRAE